MSHIFTTTLRLNLDREEDRKALEYLRSAEGYSSYSRAIVAAVNDHFSRREKLDGDPYLETREKEDAFLRRVLDTIKEGLRESGADGLGALAALLQSGQPAQATAVDAPEKEDMETAMDFINSL